MIIPATMSLGRMPKVSNGRIEMPGDKEIYVYNGKKHRDRGPAETHKRTGYKAWFRHGLLHRVNGPAVINADGSKEFWENGKLMRKEPKQ